MTENHPLVLIIEDEAPLRRYLRATLQSFGYRVEEAATGEDGRSLLLQLSPDVVLLDLGLPDGDGLELAQEIRGWSGCRSSSSAPGAKRRTRSRPWTWAPTITSPSRSGPASCWPGSG